MNAMIDVMYDDSASAGQQQWFAPLLDRLLAPLDPDLPCGPPARHDPMVTDMRLLREEDDPSLPMGQWERPLKVADWAAIEQRCITLICERSKDLQSVVWLVEAWMRQRGFVGLEQGLRVLDALLRKHWARLHPLIEDDGDCDARLAPLEWLNETLSTGIRVHAALLTVDGWRPPQVSLAHWERLAAQDMAQDMAKDMAKDAAPRDSDTATTRADLIAAASDMTAQVGATRAALRDSLYHLDSIAEFLRERLQEQAPRLATLRTVLEAAHRALLQVQAAQPPAALPLLVEVQPLHANCDADNDDVARAPEATPAPAPVAMPVQTGGWRDRSEAYATLEALAAYLARLEPHSPTPFLLMRAVRWGAMPLPEVLAEILREEGDLNRLMNVLGLQT